jgi:hypothetical protein
MKKTRSQYSYVEVVSDNHHRTYDLLNNLSEEHYFGEELTRAQLHQMYFESYTYEGKTYMYHREDGPAYISYDCSPDNLIVGEEWYFNGKSHREDGPATYSKTVGGDGDMYETFEYFVHGERHREDGPAMWSLRNGVLSEECWYINNERHREGGPAVWSKIKLQSKSTFRYGISGVSNSPLCEEMTWYDKDLIHREDGPAYIMQALVDGTPHVVLEEYVIKGNYHRIGGPAYTEYGIDGRVEIEKWYVDNKLHREDGPATIAYDVNTREIVNQEFYLYGENLAEWMKENELEYPLSTENMMWAKLVFQK